MILNGKKVKNVMRVSPTCLVYCYADGTDVSLNDSDRAFLDRKEDEAKRELSGVLVNNSQANNFEKQLLDLLVANANSDDHLHLPTYDASRLAAVQNKERRPPVMNMGDDGEHLLLPTYNFATR